MFGSNEKWKDGEERRGEMTLEGGMMRNILMFGREERGGWMEN